jgi:hypothetical protein
LEHVQNREQATKQALGAEGLSSEAGRKLRKKLKRAQRKRRRLSVVSERRAATAKAADKPAAETQVAEKADE